MTEGATVGGDLPQSELAQLAQFPDKNPGPVFWLRRDGTVLLANVAARRYLGEDLIGSCWFDRCTQPIDDLWEEVAGSDEPVTQELDFGGAVFSFSYVSSDEGDFVFAFGTDITDRVAAESQLEEVARFPDMNPGPVLRLDANGDILLANRGARDLFGDDLVGTSWFTIYPASEDRWAEITASTEPLPLETRYSGRDYQFTHVADAATGLVFVFGADISAQKQAEGQLRQSEKMATLGTLAAGVAHELNNPAAATTRAAEQMREAFANLEEAHLVMDGIELDGTGKEMVRRLDQQAREEAEKPSDLDTVTRSDLEADVEDWLDDHDIGEEWDMAPALVAQKLDADALEDLAEDLGEDELAAVVLRAAAVYPVYRLTHEMAQGAGRISEIVGALKGYSYLGQAPRQQIDLHEGIDNTLIILHNKLKVGVTVRREYTDDLPRVSAYGSELNQVWTNLIDNAADAMDGKGELTIRTRADGVWAVVEIEDNGPGIPEDVRNEIFDPFFTTKEPGKGTGLGLSTTFGIVTEKHGGTIEVDSAPGRTCFSVRLPLDERES